MDSMLSKTLIEKCAEDCEFWRSKISLECVVGKSSIRKLHFDEDLNLGFLISCCIIICSLMQLKIYFLNLSLGKKTLFEYGN